MDMPPSPPEKAATPSPKILKAGISPFAPQSRCPAPNPLARHSDNPKDTVRTLAAISNFVHFGMVVLAFLQAFACNCGNENF